MPATDIFPDDLGIAPNWAGRDRAKSRKVTEVLPSGKYYCRSYGTDIPVWDLTGICTSVQRSALINWYESHFLEGFIFRNKFLATPEDVPVVMLVRPEFQPIGPDIFMWELTLEGTTVA